VNLYETTFIINSQADDAAIDRQVKAVSDLISQNGGTVVHERRIGTRRMAYEIMGLTQGFYTSIYFEAPPSIPAVLDRFYKLEDPYIRHLTVHFDGDIEAVKENKHFGFIPEHGRGHYQHEGPGGRDGARREGSPAPRREPAAPRKAEPANVPPAPPETTVPAEDKGPAETATPEKKIDEPAKADTGPSVDTPLPETTDEDDLL